eukprot:160976_1
MSSKQAIMATQQSLSQSTKSLIFIVIYCLLLLLKSSISTSFPSKPSSAKPIAKPSSSYTIPSSSYTIPSSSKKYSVSNSSIASAITSADFFFSYHIIPCSNNPTSMSIFQCNAYHDVKRRFNDNLNGLLTVKSNGCISSVNVAGISSPYPHSDLTLSTYGLIILVNNEKQNGDVKLLWEMVKSNTENVKILCKIYLMLMLNLNIFFSNL